MFFTAPPAAETAERPSIQRLPATLAAATSSSAAVPSLEAALAAALSAATTATTTVTATTNKITVSFFNESDSASSSSSSSSSLSAASYSGFEVEDAGHGYDEAFLRGIAVSAETKENQQQTTEKPLPSSLLHPLSSLASSASSSLPLSVSVTSRPRGGFETRVAEYSGGKLERIRLRPPPGRARPGANVRVSISISQLAAAAAAASAAASAASAPPPTASPTSFLVDVVLAFALAREDLHFTALDARTRRVLLKSEGGGHGGGEGGGGTKSQLRPQLDLRALGSPASPPSYAAAVSPSSSMTARLWALVPPEGELCPSGSSSSSSSSSSSCHLHRRRCFVSVDGSPLEAPSLEAEIDSLFAEICASLLGERRRFGGGGGGGVTLQKERGTAARDRRVPAFVLKLSTTAAAAAAATEAINRSGRDDDAARFCGRMGLPLLLSLGRGGSPNELQESSSARACVREAALRCWRAVAPARLLADPLLLPLGLPPPQPPMLPPPMPPPQQQHQHKRTRFAAPPAPPRRRAPRSAPAVLVSSSLSNNNSNNLLLALSRHHHPAPSSPSQHPDSILDLEQLTSGASALVKPRGFDDWDALSSSSSFSSAVRPLSQLTAIDGRGSPTFLVAVVETATRKRDRNQKQKQQQQQLLVAFDPHAAHERVRLELLTEAYLSGAAGGGNNGIGDGSTGGVERSNGCCSSLPLPRPCELRLPRDGDEAEALRRHAAGLARWGWRWRSRSLDEAEKAAVVVVSLTHAAAVAGTRVSAADFLDHARALHLLSNSSSSSSSLSSPPPPPAAPRALASRACRGAYMFSAGHRLTPSEASSLLDSLSRTASPGICAHGRPTASALVDLGKVRALLEARREARRRGDGGGGGGDGEMMMMKKMKVGRAATTTTMAATSSLSALIESLRLKITEAEKHKQNK